MKYTQLLELMEHRDEYQMRCYIRRYLNEGGQPQAGLVSSLSGFLQEIEEAAESAAPKVGALFLHLRGQHELADVVNRQEGRQIVRDGMRDILVWTGEEVA